MGYTGINHEWDIVGFLWDRMRYYSGIFHGIEWEMMSTFFKNRGDTFPSEWFIIIFSIQIVKHGSCAGNCPNFQTHPSGIRICSVV